MGSKKLKKKKPKKLENYHKTKKEKRKKHRLCESNMKLKSVGKSFIKSISDRLSLRDHSRPSDKEKKFSDLKNFSKVRENYFRYLQRVICDNCVYYDSLVTEKILEKLALELEQNALLACLQIDIYKKSMAGIIKDIKKSTEEKQVHKDVKRLLPDSTQEKTHPNTKHTKSMDSATPVTETENINKSPIIASTKPDDEIASEDSLWAELSDYNLNLDCSTPKYQKTHSGTNSEVNTSHSPVKKEAQDEISSQLNLRINEPNSDIENTKKMTTIEIQNSFKKRNGNYNVRINTIKNFDPLSESRSQLQKIVDETLNQSRIVFRQKKDEKDKSRIVQILENDDSLDDRLNDSLSDNENESKENIDESNLMNRVEKMRDIFGLEDDDNDDEDKPLEFVFRRYKKNNKSNNSNYRHRRATIWKYEKFIQLHRYSIAASKLTLKRREANRKVFLDLFGEDSDEEHEMDYSSTEKYRSSCTERIASWVVKYLMPYYNEKRILGRTMFKSLGHHISNTIVNDVEYPDEWIVKYYVSKFFPPQKNYICEKDILNFQLT